MIKKYDDKNNWQGIHANEQAETNRLLKLILKKLRSLK